MTAKEGDNIPSDEEVLKYIERLTNVLREEVNPSAVRSLGERMPFMTGDQVIDEVADLIEHTFNRPDITKSA